MFDSAPVSRFSPRITVRKDKHVSEDLQDSAGQLVAVVVTHNRLDQLRVTIERLLRAPVTHLHAVIVVDNASSDDTPSWLRQQVDSRLVVRRSEKNLGGAGGFDLGMRHAVEVFDPDWIVVMDDDARPEPGALATFHASNLTSVDAVAAAVYHPDGRICAMNVPWVNPFWHRDVFWRTALGGGRGAFHLKPEDYARSAPVAIDGGSFVGLFLSRGAIALAGYPEPGLFIYGDDVLYTLSLKEKGARIQFRPEIKFEHDFTTIAGSVQRFVPLWKCYYHHRNLLMVYRKAAGLWFWPALLLILPKWVSKIRYYSGEKWLFLRVVGAAVRDGLRQHTGTDHSEVVRRLTRR